MAVRNESRRTATARRILDSAWQLSRERGLTGWTVRDLATRVGMRAPSLYGYFPSKNDLYDAMFAEGYDELLRAYAGVMASTAPPGEKLRTGARTFVDFAVADAARLQLLFLRVIPGFEPSAGSYQRAIAFLDQAEAALVEAGVTDPGDVDLWTATLTGLATQQASNEPGGNRWTGLVDRAVAMLLAETG